MKKIEISGSTKRNRNAFCFIDFILCSNAYRRAEAFELSQTVHAVTESTAGCRLMVQGPTPPGDRACGGNGSQDGEVAWKVPDQVQLVSIGFYSPEIRGI